MESVATTTLLSASVYLRSSWLDVLYFVARVSGALGLRCLDLALEKAAYCHLRYGVDAGLLISLDFANADIVLSVTGRRKTGHGDGIRG